MMVSCHEMMISCHEMMISCHEMTIHGWWSANFVVLLVYPLKVEGRVSSVPETLTETSSEGYILLGCLRFVVQAVKGRHHIGIFCSASFIAQGQECLAGDSQDM